jgi:hypothetical protein
MHTRMIPSLQVGKETRHIQFNLKDLRKQFTHQYQRAYVRVLVTRYTIVCFQVSTAHIRVFFIITLYSLMGECQLFRELHYLKFMDVNLQEIPRNHRL